MSSVLNNNGKCANGGITQKNAYNLIPKSCKPNERSHKSERDEHSHPQYNPYAVECIRDNISSPSKIFKSQYFYGINVEIEIK